MNTASKDPSGSDAREGRAGRLAASGAVGSLIFAIAMLLPERWRNLLLWLAPPIANLVAEFWPNAQRRIKWRLERRRNIGLIDKLVKEGEAYLPEVSVQSDRDRLIRRLRKLREIRVRLTTAVPYMDVTIDISDASPSLVEGGRGEPRDSSIRSRLEPQPDTGNAQRRLPAAASENAHIESETEREAAAEREAAERPARPMKKRERS